MRYEDLFEENSPDLFNHIEKDGMELVENKTDSKTHKKGHNYNLLLQIT